MITRYEHNGLTWVDAESPARDEIHILAEEFSLHPVITEELTTPSLRSKVDMHPNAIYLILHFPAIRHSHETETRQEVDFVIGKNFLITVHYDMIDAIHKFAKEFEVGSILKKHETWEHAGFLFYQLSKKLYRSLEHELEFIEDRLKKAESEIFKGEEYKMVAELSDINRDLIDFKQSIRSHKDVLKSLESAGAKFFGSDFSYYLESISGEFYKVQGMMDGHKETLIDLRTTNDSLLSAKTTTTMKSLALVSFFTFPLTLIAAIFGMNTKSMPIIGNPLDFWVIVSIMIATFCAILAYVIHKKWI